MVLIPVVFLARLVHWHLCSNKSLIVCVCVCSEISKIYEDERKKLDLDEYTKRLVVAKKRLHSVQATIISVQERVNRLFDSVQKDPVLNSQSRSSH